MSWLFSRALVAEYSAASCSGGEPSAPLSANPMPQAYLPSDRTTDFCRPSRFGMTFAPLTDDLGEGLLTWFLAGFRARTSVPQEWARDSKASDPDSGWKWRESLAKYDPASCSWRTRQCSLLGGLVEFSETWPRWGSMRDGEFLALETLAPRTNAKGCGLLPTPTKSWGRRGHGVSNNKDNGRYSPEIVDRCLALNKEFGWRWPCNMVETMMDWPRGWSALRPLEMARFREWLRLHGGF